MKNKKLNLIQIATIALILVVVIANGADYFIRRSASELQTDAFTAVFVDVGQGSAALFVSSCGATMLVDAGPRMARRQLRAELRRKGVRHIDFLVLTHPHEDHIGGADMVLHDFSVCTVIINDTSTTVTRTFNYDRLFSRVAEVDFSVMIVEPGDVLQFGESAYFQILAPAVGRQRDQNDYSIVMRLVYGETVLMLAGDTTVNVERWMVNNVAPQYLRACFLLVPHHGSWTSTGEEYLAAVAPRYALIQNGRGNSHGHPHFSVVSRLREFGVTYYRNDIHRTVIFQSDGRNLWRTG
ncbi:MAG: MBL fold metallo-hydrolase [Oscillospiraceae bacterium]|nr:MBL fold metallo-hydrolase [Oscillospiraceae bacterium]